MSSASTSSTFKSSLPQTEWRWIRQVLIEAVLLSSAIKLHLLPSQVWMIWMASSPSRHASQSLPRPLPSRPVLSRMILKVASDRSIDESSPPLSRALAGAMARPHVDTVLLRRCQRLLYHAPHLQMCQSLLHLRTKPGPWGIRPSQCDNSYFGKTSSSVTGARDDYTNSLFTSVFPTSYINSLAFQSLQSPFSDNEVRNAAVRVVRSSESVVLPQGSAVESTYEQDVSRQAVFHRDVPSFSQTSPSCGVGDNDPDVESNILHIVDSGDTSLSTAELSLSTTDVLRNSQIPPSLLTPEPTVKNAPGQVAESINLPQSSPVVRTRDWSKAEIEFQECLPSAIGHYQRKTVIDEWTLAKFTVPAMQTEFNTFRRISPQTGEEDVLPEGWTKHTHSDGKPYFYHDSDKVITEEWLYDTEIAEKVSRYISILNDAILQRAESFGCIKSWHLYVEIAEYEKPLWQGDNCCRCRYYFANHDEECIFWLSEYRLDDYLWELRGDMNPDFIRRFLQKEYWNHHYFFSEVHRLTKAQWQWVQKSILLTETDVNMSDTSTVTWSIDKLKSMSETIIRAEKLDTSEVAASCMMALLHDQILNYHGQRNARTNWNESVYRYNCAKEEHTIPFKIANILLFYAPIKYYTSLDKVWVDRFVSMQQRTALVEEAINKLNLSNGLATVLLAVNMAFLAIPSVDNMSADRQFPATKIFICFSVALSLGSIIIGLFFINQHTTQKQADPYVVGISFLERHWQMRLGFEKLAIVSSVPHALLMWGITFFLVSFLFMCFETPNPLSLKAFVILAYVLITALGSWCIFLFWEGSDQWIERFLVFWQRDLLSDTRNSLRFILSLERLRQTRKEWEWGIHRGSVLPTTASGE